MAVTRVDIINALRTYLDGGALTTAITAVNAAEGAPLLPSPAFYHFGDRIIEKQLKAGTWVVCIAYVGKSTVEDQPKYRLEDWTFMVIGIAHNLKQVEINKWVLKIEDALVRALDAQSTGLESKWFGLDAATIKDVTISGSGISPIEDVGGTFMMEAAVELSFSAAICRA